MQTEHSTSCSPTLACRDTLETQADVITVLFAKLSTLPTAVKCLQALLTQSVDGATELLVGDDLKKQVVFAFAPKTDTPNASCGVAM